MSLDERLDALIDEYLAVGCPCRFPRFRAVVGRDTSKQAGGSFTSEDQRAAIRAYERKTPLVDRAPLEPYTEIMPGMWVAKCGVCNNEVRRATNEYSRNGYIDFLVLKRPANLDDLGAPLERNRVLRCRPFEAPGPAMGGMHKAAQLSPFVEEDAWFAWLRERA